MPAKKFTNTDLARPVTGREKVSDTKCRGLYASITPNGVTFSFRYYDSAQRKQLTIMVGRFDPERFTVEQARAKAYDLKADVGQGVNIAARAREAVEQKRAAGLTFDQVADEWIAYLKTPVKKQDGEMRPRRESWDRVVGYLVRPRKAFGGKVIAEVTDDDVALLLNGLIDDGKVGLSVNIRTALFGLFKWAGQPGRKYVRASPCSNLGERPEMFARERALSENEVAALWRALDAIDVPVPRSVALAFKLILCTGLRPGEVCSMRREEIVGLDGATPEYRIPLKRVKKRRPIYQPLNSLAVGIVRELMAMSAATTGSLFPPGPNGAEFKRHMLTDYMTDRGYNGFKPKDGVVRRHGLLGYLGFAEAWRPHDLRRTAATLLGSADVGNRKIGEVLDHQDKDANVTTSVYNKAERMAHLKRPTLDLLDQLLRNIIAPKPFAPAADSKVVRLGRAA